MADTSVSYQCLNCGAPLNYHPGDEHVVCEFCDTKFNLKDLEAEYARKEEKAAAAQAAKEAQWETTGAEAGWSEQEAAMMHAFTCSSCGAEIVCDENTMATECCYCGNPTMIPSRFTGMLKPDYIIPFKRTKEDAVAALQEFYRNKPLLPDAFIANNRVEAIQPMYVPFWLFDANITAQASFRTTTESVVTTNDAIITTVNHYSCERVGQMVFGGVPVDGSKKMDDTFMESIEPFDYSELVPFNTGYLAGYLADKYDVDSEQAVVRADERIYNSAEQCLEDTVMGFVTVRKDEPAIVNKDTGKISYAMVPVWILTTRFNDKPYTFMMNGQTGKVVGSLPIDKSKLLTKTLITFAISFVVLFTVAYFVLK